MSIDDLPNHPHAESVLSVFSRLDVRAERGLSSNEVVLRRRRFGRNLLRRQPSVGLLRIIWNQFRSPVIALLAGAAVLAGVFSRWADCVAILAVLVINSAIGLTTELRAVRSMEALRQLTARSVRVRRGGLPN